MSEAKIIFTLDGINLTIQCTLEDKIKDICQKYSTKIDNKINTLIFLYGGCQMNMELKFKEQANSIDKNNKEMRVLVYKKENEDFMCPNCGVKINLNKNKINDIILCNNKLKESINGIKFNIENLINISTNNIISSQLKNINVIINAINEDINRNNDRLTSLFNEDINMSNENIIKGVSDIKLNEKTNNSNQILNNINIQPPNKLNINLNYGDYSLKIIELINNIREDPSGYADIIEDSIKYIFKINDKDNPTKERFIFKKEVKVALNRGEPAFREAAEYLRTLDPLPLFKFKSDICIPLPENEDEINDHNFLRKQVIQIKTKSKVDVYFKDLIKIPETSALINIVDDNCKDEGKKRMALLNKDLKYIGVSSKFIGNKFIAYFAFSK